MVLNHHRYSITNDQMSHVQYVNKIDDSMFDGKLLPNEKMPLMANQPLFTFFQTSTLLLACHNVLIIQQ